MSPPADGKHEAPDRPRQQHAPTNGNHGEDIRASSGTKAVSNETMEDLHGSAVIIRIGIPDLQQTVSVWSRQGRSLEVQEPIKNSLHAKHSLLFTGTGKYY